MSFARTFAATLATKGAGFVLTFIMGVVVARTLGAPGKGSVDALFNAFSLLLLIYPSLDETQTYLIARRQRPIAVYFANAIVLSLVFGALVYGGFRALSTVWPELFLYKDRVSPAMVSMDLRLLGLYCMAAPLEIFIRLSLSFLQAQRAMRAFNAVHLVLQGVHLLLILLIVVQLQRGVPGAVFAQVLALATTALVVFWLCFQKLGAEAGPFRVDAKEGLALVAKGFRIHGGVVAAYVILMSDILILNRYFGPSVVGFYALAAALTGQLRRVLLQPMKEALGAHLPELRDDPKKAAELIAVTCRHTVVLNVLPSLVLAAIGWPFLRVTYGAEFTATYLPLVILIPGGIAWSVAVLLSQWLVFRDRLWTLTAVGAFVALTNIGLNLLFIPRFGMVAAAATSTACYLLHMLIFSGFVARSTNLKQSAFFWPKRADIVVYRQVLEKLWNRIFTKR